MKVLCKLLKEESYEKSNQLKTYEPQTPARQEILEGVAAAQSGGNQQLSNWTVHTFKHLWFTTVGSVSKYRHIFLGGKIIPARKSLIHFPMSSRTFLYNCTSYAFKTLQEPQSSAHFGSTGVTRCAQALMPQAQFCFCRPAGVIWEIL